MTVPMLLHLDRLRALRLERDPFDFVVVDNFIRAEYMAAVVADFPALPSHGSFPLLPGMGGADFARLAAELEGEPLRRAIEEKFAIDLSDRPTMIALGGMSDGKDVRIHAESTTEIITLLLYMNPAWER